MVYDGFSDLLSNFLSYIRVWVQLHNHNRSPEL